MTGIWALLPIKNTANAKQRLSAMFDVPQRQKLALVMAADVLGALVNSSGLAGVAVVTLDAAAGMLAKSFGARVIRDGAGDGHTGAVNAGTRRLRADGASAVMTLPLDVPLVTSAEIDSVIAVHGRAPSFTIVPAHDRLGSNCILRSPPDSVPLSFGEDSFYPHLRAARRAGINPVVSHQPGLALDIDHPADVKAFMRIDQTTSTRLLLREFGIPCCLATTHLPRQILAAERGILR